MLVTALPLLALAVRGDTPAALVIAIVEAAPYLLATALAFAIGLGRLRVPPRALLIWDCLLRGVLFVGLGVLALSGDLSLPVLVCGLLFGSVFRMVAISSRRLVMTALVEPAGLFAVNGLLSTSQGITLYAAGPVLGGVLSAVGQPGVALLVDGLSFFLLLVVLLVVVPAQSGSVRGTSIPASGLRILRRVPMAARLCVVVFCVNLFYMPVEVALPLLVRGPLGGDGATLGVIWAGFGIGTLIGAIGTNWLRRLPQQRLLVAIIAAQGLVVVLLLLVPTASLATAVFFALGVVYAPFTPVVYTLVQSVLHQDEQQPVLTLWSAVSVLAAPIGLGLAGPLITAVGVHGGLAVSAGLTLVLVPIAGMGLRRDRDRAGDQPVEPVPR